MCNTSDQSYRNFIDALNQQLNANRDSCATADQAYQDLLAALEEARS